MSKKGEKLITRDYPYKLPTYEYTNTSETNSIRGVEKFIGSFEYKTFREEWWDWGRLYDRNNSEFYHFLGSGRFYKGLAPIGMPSRTYLNQSFKSVPHPYPSGAY